MRDKFLDLLYDYAEEQVNKWYNPKIGLRDALEFVEFPAYLKDLYVRKVLKIDTSIKQKGVKQAKEEINRIRAFGFSMDMIERHQLIVQILARADDSTFERHTPVVGFNYHFSSLGVRFVEACRAPKKG